MSPSDGKPYILPQETSQIIFICEDSDIFSPQFQREEASDVLLAMLWLLCPDAGWRWQSHPIPTKQYQDHKQGCRVVWVLILPPDLPPDGEERKPLPCCTPCTSSCCRTCGSKRQFADFVAGSRWGPFSQVNFTIIIASKNVSNILELTKISFFHILNYPK